MSEAETTNESDVIIQWFKSETFWQGVAASTVSTGALSIGALVVALVLGLVDWRTLLASVLGFLLVVSVTTVIVVSRSTGGKQRARVKGVLSNEQSGVSPGPAWIGIIVSVVGLIIIWLTQLSGMR